MEQKITSAQHLASAFGNSPSQRVRAAAIHLGLSAAIFIPALIVIMVKWYPGFHFTVDGGWQGVRILAAVQLVLGPLLTLIIFNTAKRRQLIVLDLGCIVFVQLCALVLGLHTIHSQKPVSVNYSDGEFYSMTARPLEIEKYPASLLKQLSDRTPAMLYVAPPANEDEEIRVAMMEMMSGLAPHEDPFFFRALAPHWEVVKQRAINANVNVRDEPLFAQELDEFLAERGGVVSDYRFFPFSGRYGMCTLVFDNAGLLLDALNCQMA